MNPTTEQLLHDSVVQTSARCLFSAAKWSGELLYQRPQESDRETKYLSTDPEIMLAQNLFVLGEYDRVSNMLKHKKDDLGTFLCWYSRLIGGEKHVDELATPTDKTGHQHTREKQIQLYTTILRVIEEHGETSKLDGFQQYLYGLVLSKTSQYSASRNVLIESIQQYSMNWSAWLELSRIVYSKEQFEDILGRVPGTCEFAAFFKMKCQLQLGLYQECLQTGTQILEKFGPNVFTYCIFAEAYNELRQREETEKIYQRLFKEFPYSLEGLDLYSNILFVREDLVKLTLLAQKAMDLDPYRLETNFIVGNLHSLRQDHEKAIMYFKRCLAMDKTYLPAWTLLGHEWIECKITNLAIECYQTAIDLDPREYRAWFGLGQTYEMIRKPFDALYCYKKAAITRPGDARMWTAMGGCYESLKRTKDAVSCYLRAIDLDEETVERDEHAIERELQKDPEFRSPAVESLAKLHARLGDECRAELYYRVWIATLIPAPGSEQILPNTVIPEEAIDPCLYLSHHYQKEGDYRRAIRYAQLLVNIPGPEKEEAKAILYDCYSKLAGNSGQ